MKKMDADGCIERLFAVTSPFSLSDHPTTHRPDHATTGKGDPSKTQELKSKIKFNGMETTPIFFNPTMYSDQD